MATNSASGTLTPTRLSELYEACLRAVDAEGAVPQAALRFASWLADHWRNSTQLEPMMTPDAVSCDRRGVAMIRWYGGSRGITGWVPGGFGYYFIPETDEIPRE
ncbi:MAG: hypothetical protein IT336_15725 [Thermomicrobiales bacterium]|nr:hypothetical protein [Thermomicrobiales bacterium]